MANLQPQILTPLATKISRNSSIGGMSNFSISFFIMLVAKLSIPGNPPKRVGMCMAGFPTVATCKSLSLLLLMASNPKNVKNISASMPSMRAPFAKMNAAYTLSKVDLLTMMQTFLTLDSALTIGSVTGFKTLIMFSLYATYWFWDPCYSARFL